MFNDILDYCEKGTFYVELGYFLLQHLVMLVSILTQYKKYYWQLSFMYFLSMSTNFNFS